MSNLNNLISRTASIFGMLIISFLALYFEYFVSYAIFIVCLGFLEYFRAYTKNSWLTCLYFAVFGIFSIATIRYDYFPYMFELLYSFNLMPLLFVVIGSSLIAFNSKKDEYFKCLSLPVYSFLFFVTTLVTLNLIVGGSYLFFFFVLAITVLTDIFAYLSGNAYGKRKLCRHLSSGKTVEGVIGGVFFAVLLAPIIAEIFINYGIEFFNYLGYVEAKGLNSYLHQQDNVIYFALMISLLSVVGDLYQSMFKRLSGCKDTGKIIPGHGGIFDRIDSSLLTIPYAYFLFADIGNVSYTMNNTILMGLAFVFILHLKSLNKNKWIAR